MDTIKRLFNIKYPIVQGGMIWCSGWELAAAVSNAGGLGLIGSGSMYPHILDEHITKCKQATDKPFERKNGHIIFIIIREVQMVGGKTIDLPQEIHMLL